MPTVASRPDGLETRRAILDAALDLFSERSFDGASTRAIAEAVGVTQPLLNYHFAGKEELWRAAVNDLFERLRSSMRQQLDDLSGTDEIAIAKQMVRHFVEFSAANPQLHRIIMQESKRAGDRLDWMVDTHVRPLYDNAVRLFDSLAAQGAIAPVASVHLYYLLTGAGATVFVMAPECRRLTGIDPFAPEFVAVHADLVVDLLIHAATPKD
jgi:AcrR family transcriptional regulator